MKGREEQKERKRHDMEANDQVSLDCLLVQSHTHTHTHTLSLSLVRLSFAAVFFIRSSSRVRDFIFAVFYSVARLLLVPLHGGAATAAGQMPASFSLSSACSSCPPLVCQCPLSSAAAAAAAAADCSDCPFPPF